MRRRLGRSWLVAVLLALATAVSAAAGKQGFADLQLSKSDAPDPVVAGGQITYDIVIFNAGPDTSEFVSIEDTLPAGTTFVDLIVADPTWTCSAPAVGSGGTVSCSKDALEADTSGAFTLVVAVDSARRARDRITNTRRRARRRPIPTRRSRPPAPNTTVVAPPPTRRSR